MNKISLCCILNHAPHYRKSIHEQMAKEFDCHFYFGDKVISPVKQLNFEELPGFKRIFKNRWILGTSFMWHFGVNRLLLKKYDHFLITGEPAILSNWFILIIGKILNKKVSVWGHGIKDLKPRRLFWFEKLFYKFPFKIFVYGNHARDNMLQLGHSESNVITIYNSLSYFDQVEIRKNLGPSKIYSSQFGNEYPTILYVGRILVSKKVDQLILAFEHLNKTNIKLNLAIVGPAVDDDRIPQMIENSNFKQNIWLYGPCYEEQKLAELFFNATVSVTPGDIGLLAIHSLTYGCPVISHDNVEKHGPEFEVIIESKTGSFFKEDDIIDLSKKIEHWVKKDNDEKSMVNSIAKKTIDQYWNPVNQVNVLKDNLTRN